MGMAAWQLASHAAITLIAVVTLALRIEHRITKVETDVTWIKLNINKHCNGDDEDE